MRGTSLCGAGNG
uniref:Uncharacterized protein n=1 Tax=Arundo donax TaxID=35708 RepID=A0A0A9FU48_ARUDO